MADNLVRRVRLLVKRLRTCSSDQGGWVYEEAADCIEELYQLMRINKSKYESCCKDSLEAIKRIEQLEAALKKIAHVNNTTPPFNSYVDKEIWLALKEHRAALEGKDAK